LAALGYRKICKEESTKGFRHDTVELEPVVPKRPQSPTQRWKEAIWMSSEVSLQASILIEWPRTWTASRSLGSRRIEILGFAFSLARKLRSKSGNTRRSLAAS
jgi:hypothetical protein